MKNARTVDQVIAVSAKGAEMASSQYSRPNLSESKRNVSAGLLKHRLGLMTIIGASLIGSTGCNLLTSSVKVAAKDVHSWVDESMANYRDRTLAEKAWIRERAQHRKHEYTSELKQGFIAGYLAVAGGGNGCTPPIAPQEYWGWKYQSPFGQAAVRAWFEGYPLGAKAADVDGVGNWSRVQLNLREPEQFQPVGETATEGESVAPVPTILEPSPSDSSVIPSPSDLPEAPSIAGSRPAGLGRAANTPGTNEFNAFMNQASSTSAPKSTMKSLGLEFPGIAAPGVSAPGAVSMTGSGTGDGKVESPANYDDWLKNIQGNTLESQPESEAIEFQFDSESEELPFTVE